MRRQANRVRGSRCTVLLVLVAAAALAAGSCGGLDPGDGDAPDPAPGALDVPPVVMLDPDESQRVDPALLSLVASQRVDPALIEQVTGKGIPNRVTRLPEYKQKQVLSLCDEGTMIVSDERAKDQLAGDFTLELWMKLRRPGDQSIAWAEGLQISLRDLRVHARIGGQELVSLPVTTRTWSHVALAVAGPTVRLFVNGVFMDSVVIPDRAWKHPGGALIFGASTERESALCGYLDNVRLTGEALYTDHFLPGLIELWRLESSAFFYTFDDQKHSQMIFDAGIWGVNARIEGNAMTVPGTVN